MTDPSRVDGIPHDRIPLVIGVTGHRDLPDEVVPDIEAAVVDVLERLQRDYLGHRGATPIVVLSALAEGADHIVARVALKHGARVVAPLPLPRGEYRRDFEKGIKANAAANFEQWLECDDVPKLTIPFTPGNSLEGAQNDRSKRDEQYRAVGQFIVRHCDALIALWDGRGDEGVGGTAEIVRFKRHGVPLAINGSPRASLDAPEIGPVIHILTPRAGTATPPAVSVRPWGVDLASRFSELRKEIDDRPGATEADRRERRELVDELEREQEVWTSFGAVVRLTERLNQEVEKLGRSAKGRARLSEGLDRMFSGTDGKLDVAARDKAVEIAPRWCSIYAAADTLARKWQVRFRFDWLSLFLLAFVTIGCFEVLAHLAPVVKPYLKNEWAEWIDLALLGGYLMAFFVILVIFSIGRRRQHQERFLDYRALAESMRVAVFWKLNDIGSIADAYPIKLPQELAWVKACLLTCELLDAAEHRKPPPSDAPEHPDSLPLDARCYGWARNLWIAGQRAFFRSRSATHLHRAERRETISKAILFVIFLLVVALILLLLRAFVKREEPSFDLFLFFLGILPAIAAALVGHAEQLAFKAQARHFDRMRELFEGAFQLLPREPPPGTASALVRGVFRELGAEAIHEHAEWVAIYRQRPIRPPQG